MHTAKRAIRRLAFIGWLGLFGLRACRRIRLRPRHPRSESCPTRRSFCSSSTMSNRFARRSAAVSTASSGTTRRSKDFRDELASEARGRHQGAQGKDRRQPQASCSSFPKGPCRRRRRRSRDDPKLPVAVRTSSPTPARTRRRCSRSSSGPPSRPRRPAPRPRRSRSTA